MKLIATMLSCALSFPVFAGTINVSFKDIKSNEGQMIVYVYNSDDGFPTRTSSKSLNALTSLESLRRLAESLTI